MISNRVKEISQKIYRDYAKRFPNCEMEDLNNIDKILSEVKDITDRDYLGIVIGMEYAYEDKDLVSFNDRFYYSYGYNEFFKNVKDNSLESSDQKLHTLESKNRLIASYGFMKAYEELKKGMESDGLLKGKRHEKIKC